MPAMTSLWPQSVRSRTTAWAMAYQRTTTFREARARRLRQLWINAIAWAMLAVGGVLTFAAITGFGA
jgi:ribosomal protein L20